MLSSKAFREGEILFNGKKLSKETSITDGKGNIIKWDDIMDNDKLVFYFSETSCDMCVDMEIARLNEKTGWTVFCNTVILIGSTNKRYVTQYKNSHKLRFPVYEIKSNTGHFLPALPL